MGGMAPIWGFVADRYGHRLMIQRATFGAGLGVALIAFVQTPEQLLFLRVVHGFFTGVVAAIATLVSLTAPRQHLGTVLGMLQAAMFTGVSLGPLLGGAFVDHFGLRAAFFSTGVILFVMGLLVAVFVGEPSREPRRVGAAAGPEAAGRQRRRPGPGQCRHGELRHPGRVPGDGAGLRTGRRGGRPAQATCGQVRADYHASEMGVLGRGDERGTRRNAWSR